jgi:uncharacterized membrane protein YbhN (UPF0104 family)
MAADARTAIARPALGGGVWRRVITAALAAGVATGVLAGVHGLTPVARELTHASPGFVALALALEIASCAGFVIVFRRVFDAVPTGAARELAWFQMGSGALLPAGGIGGLALGGWLLHVIGMPARQIVRRSSALFFITSAVNAAAMIAAALLVLTGAGGGHDRVALALVPLVLALSATALVLALPARVPRSSRGAAWAAEAIDGIRMARTATIHPSWRLLGAAGYLGFDIAALWASFAALGYHPPAGQLVLGYLIGYLANLVPIPGGIGILDAGLAGTLILYGVPAAPAAGAVLVYHAIAFWIPSLGGGLAYALLRHRLAGASRRSAELHRISL